MTATKTLPDPRQRPWLTVSELAEITGEGEKAIRAALEAGQLPVLRIGRYVRIPTAALLTTLGITPESGGTDPATGPATVTSIALTKDSDHDHDKHAPGDPARTNIHPIRGL